MSLHDYKIPHGSQAFSSRCKVCGVNFKSVNDWSTVCRVCWVESKKSQDKFYRPPNAQQNETIPPDMMRRLLMLCHPDKHNDSEMSRNVTQWLLEIKNNKPAYK